MKLSPAAKEALLRAISQEREKVVQEREKRAKDFSRKWNDSDERIAISLDTQRDELDCLAGELSKPTGILEW